MRSRGEGGGKERRREEEELPGDLVHLSQVKSHKPVLSGWLGGLCWGLALPLCCRKTSGPCALSRDGLGGRT